MNTNASYVNDCTERGVISRHPLSDIAFRVLANIKIHRIMQAQGETVILQTFEHSTCAVKNYQQEGDYIEFSFNFMIFKDIFVKYDKEGGKVGQVASFYNYETLESDIEA